MLPTDSAHCLLLSQRGPVRLGWRGGVHTAYRGSSHAGASQAPNKFAPFFTFTYMMKQVVVALNTQKPR